MADPVRGAVVPMSDSRLSPEYEGMNGKEIIEEVQDKHPDTNAATVDGSGVGLYERIRAIIRLTGAIPFMAITETDSTMDIIYKGAWMILLVPLMPFMGAMAYTAAVEEHGRFVDRTTAVQWFRSTIAADTSDTTATWRERLSQTSMVGIGAGISLFIWYRIVTILV